MGKTPASSLTAGAKRPKSVFVYELITGGGLFALPDAPAPSGSLLREGAAMLAAVVADFQTLGSEVTVLRDIRLSELPLARARQLVVDHAASEKSRFAQAARQSEATLVIAPEFDGLLLQRVGWAEASSRWLLGPGSRFVEAASCKLTCYDLWRKAGVPTIESYPLSESAAWEHLRELPVVTKPVDGAGSDRILRWNSGKCIPAEVQQDEKILIQPQVLGTPVSCASVGAGDDFFLLPPGYQHLDNDFKFLGGSFPLPEDLSCRALPLTRRAVEALPPFRGYVGIDMILGPCPEGSDDVAVEVNPRLTSSYLGLRRYLKNNLAQVMLDGAASREWVIEVAQTSVEYEIL